MIITISNQKGGCAKTTTAINLAASFAALGQRTLLIDLDPQTHASMGLGIKTDTLDYSIYNVLSERAEQKKFIENVIRPFGANLDIAPGHVLLSTIEQEFVDKELAVGRLRTVLENITFPYQYIIIDCPPSLGFLTFNALFAADLAIVPIDLGSFALFGVANLLSMVELIRVKMGYSPKVYALATLVDLRSRFAREMLQHIQGAFRDNMFESIIHLNVACRESQRLGIPVRYHNEKSRASVDYENLAKEIVVKFQEDAYAGIEKNIHEPRGRVKEFELDFDKAGNVHIVGDFNNWRIDESSRLWHQGKGSWHKRLHLQPGRYRYKFVVDGRWIPDPSNKHAEPNPYGGIDSVIEIS